MNSEITKHIFDTLDRIEDKDLQRKATESTVLDILRDCNYDRQELARRLMELEAA